MPDPRFTTLVEKWVPKSVIPAYLQVTDGAPPLPLPLPLILPLPLTLTLSQTLIPTLPFSSSPF